MGKKSASAQFARSADQASARAGGSHLTQEARDRTLDRFQSVMQEAGYNQIRSVDDLATRHLEAYVEARIADDVSVRTLQNELSHIRSVMDPDRAANPRAQNAALGTNYRWDQDQRWVPVTKEDRDQGITGGVTGGSRVGTSTAVTAEELQSWTAQARELGREGFACAMEVSMELGLRSQEIIRASAEQLHIWIRETSTQGQVTIIHGTKGGRVRDTKVLHPARTVAVLRRAAAVADAQGGYLIVRANGSPTSLKSATRIYRSYANRQGIKTHRCRYAYAREVYQHFRAQGYSHKEACIRTAVYLGHGESRDRYVNSVYLR